MLKPGRRSRSCPDRLSGLGVAAESRSLDPKLQEKMRAFFAGVFEERTGSPWGSLKPGQIAESQASWCVLYRNRRGSLLKNVLEVGIPACSLEALLLMFQKLWNSRQF